MKMSLTQNLVEDVSRPIIANYYGGLALIDTGAEIPVCTLPVMVLEKMFQAELRMRNASITGFGGDDYGDIYTIGTIELQGIIYPNIPVFVPRRNRILGFRWILSATMLDRLEYNINMKTHTMTINIPDDESNVRNLRLYDKDGKIHILCET